MQTAIAVRRWKRQYSPMSSEGFHLIDQQFQGKLDQKGTRFDKMRWKLLIVLGLMGSWMYLTVAWQLNETDDELCREEARKYHVDPRRIAQVKLFIIYEYPHGNKSIEVICSEHRADWGFLLDGQKRGTCCGYYFDSGLNGSNRDAAKRDWPPTIVV